MTHKTLFGELLLDAAERCGDDAGLVTPSGFVGYRSLCSRALGLATFLQELGVEPGDNVGIYLPNGPAFLEALFAVGYAGAAPVTLNTRYRSHELSHAIRRSDMTALLTTSASPVDYSERIAAALPGLAAQHPKDGAVSVNDAPALRYLVRLGSTGPDWLTPAPAPGAVSGDTLVKLASSGAWRRAGSNEPALLTYTSGTTSRPKLCMLSHRSLIRTCTSAAIERIGLRRHDVIWNPAPLFHVSAFVSLIGALKSGCTYTTAQHFDATEMLDLFVRYPVTVAFANFANFYYALMDSPSFRPASLSHLRIFTISAVESEILEIRNAFPGAIQLGLFGATELSGTACITTPDDDPDSRARTAAGRSMAWKLAFAIQKRVSASLQAKPARSGCAAPVFSWVTTAKVQSD